MWPKVLIADALEVLLGPKIALKAFAMNRPVIFRVVPNSSTHLFEMKLKSINHEHVFRKRFISRTICRMILLKKLQL